MDEWIERSFGELTCVLRRGTAPLYVEASAVRAIGQRCVRNEGFDAGATRPHDSRVEAVVRPEIGDVLINSTGTGTIGRSCVFCEGQGDYMVDGHVTLARPVTSEADGRFLNELVRSPSGQRFLESHCFTGSTNQVELSRTQLSEMPVVVPRLEEQRRIAEILDTIDETIQATERVIAKLGELRKGLLMSILDSYFPGRGPIVERAAQSTAECVLLSELMKGGEIELGRGNVISAIDIAADPGPYPIYSSSASARGEFGRYGKFMFDEELITWSVDGGGRPFHRPRHRFSVTNVGGFLRIRKNELWLYRFVHALMEVQHFQLSFDWLMKAHPSVIRDLYWFPRVSLAEQQQATNRLDVADDSLLREREKRDKLVAVRAGLAADLLSGCVRTVAA